MPAQIEVRMEFNPNLTQAWFGGVMEVINQITMLSIILTGAALIREREHGTVEHLLVMPLSAFEIMMAKVWSMGLVVLVAAGSRCSGWCVAGWTCRSAAQWDCSCSAPDCICSPPPPWAYSSARWRARCRSSGC